ncbi:MAG: hypothetical protein KAT00_04915 [Planctomycetes bacterium]|nr:hypothetical protein [Planctomycetota bacterium]
MDAYRAALLAQSQAQQATAAFTAPSPGAETVPSEDAPNPNPPPAGEDADVRVGQDGGYDPDVPGSNVTLAGTTDTPIDVPAAPQAQGIVAQIVAALQRIIAALTGGMETYDG